MPTHHLLPGFSLWGLEGLHDPPATGISAVKAAGYSTLEVGFIHLTDALVERVRTAGLRLIVQRHCLTVEELVPALDAAKRHGAMLVNAHVGTPHLSASDAAELVNRMIEGASSRGVRLLFETHRGRITQDLYRTLDLLQAVPEMRLTLDVSHYIVCEEKPGPVPELMPLLSQLFERTEMIHGRVSNGEQIQVDVGDGTGELPQRYRDFWCEAMRAWRLRSAPGSALVFTPELGPPTYAMTDLAGRELSNRWEQSLVLRRLAEEAWKASALPAA
jgi:sugar phosphate isomerase/epimerase